MSHTGKLLRTHLAVDSIYWLVLLFSLIWTRWLWAVHDAPAEGKELGKRPDAPIAQSKSLNAEKADIKVPKIERVSINGGSACILAVDGSLTCMEVKGPSEKQMAILKKQGVSQVEAGGFHRCAVTKENQILCWGKNDFGQSVVPKRIQKILEKEKVRQLVAGGQHSCVLFSTAQVECWGKSYQGQLQPTKEQQDQMKKEGVKRLIAGDNHNCVLTEKGSIICWGANDFGQRVPNEKAKKRIEEDGGISMLTAGAYHTCGLTKKGRIVCWGWDGFKVGRVPEKMSDQNYKAIRSGSGHNCVVTLKDQVQCWGNNIQGQVTVPEEVQQIIDRDKGVRKIITGSFNTCVITHQSEAWLCWGQDKDWGQKGYEMRYKENVIRSQISRPKN